jgi:hypothetical protein
MERYNIFSPFYYKTHITETEFLKQIHLEAILVNYKASPNHSHDWNMHTSYGHNEDLPFQINWEHFFFIYKDYIDQFCLEFFGAGKSWEIIDNIWYNVYGKEQNGMQHNHIGADFSVVHYLKFNPEIHTGTTFINPRSNEVLYYKNISQPLIKNLEETNIEHSLYQEVFTPNVNEGDFIIFPSHLDHVIYKNNSDDFRVTTALNFKIL